MKIFKHGNTVVVIIILLITLVSWYFHKKIETARLDDANVILYNHYDQLATSSKGIYKKYYSCVAESFRSNEIPDCMKPFNPKK